MKTAMKDFLKDLAAVLEKHGADISFNPRHMDTHGSGDSGIEFELADGTRELFSYNWSVNAHDLKKRR